MKLRIWCLLAAASGLLGCTTLSPQTSDVIHSPPPVGRSHALSSPTTFAKMAGDCGPLAMAVALNGTGRAVQPQDLRSRLLTPGKDGTLPTTIVGTAREYGLMAIPVTSMRSLLIEIAAGHPVVVFQNLGFGWLPNWHYTVAVGYDLDRQEITSVDDRVPTATPMTYFERHWSLADFWGLVILNPDQLAPSADELAHLKAAAALEQLGQLGAAQLAYEKIILAWPQSLGGRIGLGNIFFRQKEYLKAAQTLKTAVELHPDSPMAQHNLQVARSHLSK